jgi:hypothetical protein
VDFFDADGLTGEDRAEIDFFLAQTDAATTRDHDDLVVEGIVNVRQSLIDAGGGLIDLRRTFHVFDSLLEKLLKAKPEPRKKIKDSGQAQSKPILAKLASWLRQNFLAH